MLAKERNRSLPRISRRFRFIDLGPRVVEERVIRAGVNLHFDLLAEIFYLTFQIVHRVRRNRAVLFTKDTEHGCVQFLRRRQL